MIRYERKCDSRPPVFPPVENHRSLSCDAEELGRAFLNEVIDQELREVMSEETTNIRDVLLAEAFSAVNLLDMNGDEGSPDRDPLGIQRFASEKRDH